MKWPLLALLSEVSAETPISRVVKLIEGLKEKISSDEKSEEKSYNKYACWCVNMSEKKGKAIEDGKAEIKALHSTYLMYKAKVTTNKNRIAMFEKTIAHSQEAIDAAHKMHTKMTEEWQEEHAETLETLNGLERAIKVLKAGSSFLQADTQNTLMAVADSVKTSNAASVRKFMSLMGAQYAPQSGTVQGILQEMYKTFSTNLMQGSSDYLKSASATQDLIKKNTNIIEESTEQLAAEKKSLGENSVKMAEAEEDYNASNKQLMHDVEFFTVMEKGCEEKRVTYDDRVAKRERELAGVTEALKILEENRDQFNKSFRKAEEADGTVTSFLQTKLSSSAKMQSARNKLVNLARKARSPRIALIAQKAKNSGTFKVVLDMIDEMVKTLKEEAKTDDKQNQECLETEQQFKTDVDDGEYKIAVAERKIGHLEKENKDLEKKRDQAAEAINDAFDRLEKAEEERKSEHEVFLQTQEDDKMSVEVLDKVRAALTKYYEEESASFLQAFYKDGQDPEFEISEEQAPVAEFAPATSNDMQNTGIVSLIENLLGGLQQKIRDDATEESESYAAFKEMEKVTHEEIDQLDAKIERYEERMDTISLELGDQAALVSDTEAEVVGFKEAWAQEEPDCSWIKENIDQRRGMREAEVAGLNDVKTLLEGGSI